MWSREYAEILNNSETLVYGNVWAQWNYMQNCCALSFLRGGDEGRPWIYQILEGIEELMKRADLYRGVVSWNH